VRDAYPYPEAALPVVPTDVLTERLRRFEELCSRHGVATRNTRVDRYRRYLELPRKGWDLDTGIFIAPPGSPIQHGLDRLLYVMREVHELTWIGEGLREADNDGLADKLRVVVRGADFAALDRNTESRNTQFELRIASYLQRAGFRISFSTLTDIIATRDSVTYYIECKRVASPALLTRRIKEAADQVEARMPLGTWSRGRYGVVAADVSRVAFTRNGLTWGRTADHARDSIRKELSDIHARHLQNGSSLIGRRVLGIWLQIHIPCLILNPPQPATYFSSLFLGDMKPGIRSAWAMSQFMANALGPVAADPEEIPSQPVELRNSITIPAKTSWEFDDDLLESLVTTGELPERAPDDMVLKVWAPGMEADDDPSEAFAFFEVKVAFDGLPIQDRQHFTKSRKEAGGLLAPVLLQRYRYGKLPAWLDVQG
jgi:hypothetical protein